MSAFQSWWWEWLSHAIVYGSALVLLALVAGKLLNRKLPPVWLYGLWFVVLLRLLVPLPTVFSPAWPLESKESALEQTPAEEDATENAESGLELYSPTPVAPPAFRPVVAISDAPQLSRAEWFLESAGAFWVWLFGFLAVMVATLWQYNRLVREIRTLKPVSDQRVLDCLDRCKRELGVFVPLDVMATNVVESPALVGYLRPRLLLPPNMLEALDDEELRFVLLHELAHFSRGDVPTNWMIACCQACHWFNPLVWWGLNRMRLYQEMACDRRVLTVLGERKHRDYGRAVIKVLELSGGYRPVTGMVGLLENSAHLVGRIRMIDRFAGVSRFQRLLGILLISLLILSALTGIERSSHGASAVIDALVDAYQAGDIDTLMTLYDPDAVFYEVDSQGGVMASYGVRGVRDWYAMTRTYSPNFEILERSPEGNMLSYRAALRTGRFEVVGLFETEGLGRITVLNGRIIEHVWQEDDTLKKRRLALFDHFIEWAKTERPDDFKRVFGSELFIRHRASGDAVNKLFFEWIETRLDAAQPTRP